MRLAAILMLMATAAIAQPQISGVTGEVARGEPLVIYGSSFGTKSAAAPWIWDDFEGGSALIGQSIAANDTRWSTPHLSLLYADNWAHSGSVSARTNSRGFWSLYPVPHRQTTEIYMTGWMTTDDWGPEDISSQYSLVIKFWRMNCSLFGAPPPYNGPLYHNFGFRTYSPGSLPEVSSFRFDYIPGTNNSGGFGPEVHGYSTTWHWNLSPEAVRVEYYARLSTPGVADGYAYSQHIGLSGKNEATNIMQRQSGCTLLLDTALFQMAAANSAGDAVMYAWGDDFYADTTQSRVELGNNAVFASCTLREIQIPSAWDNNSITVTVNNNVFAAESTAYLFVINSAGVASPGFAVTVGGEIEAVLIGPPGTPVVSEVYE